VRAFLTEKLDFGFRIADFRMRDKKDISHRAHQASLFELRPGRQRAQRRDISPQRHRDTEDKEGLFQKSGDADF